MKCTTKAIIMTFFIIFNIALPWLFAFILFISYPGSPCNYRDIEEVKSLENLSPLLSLRKKYNTPLFGGNQPLIHAHDNYSNHFIDEFSSDKEDNKIKYYQKDKKNLNYNTYVDDSSIKIFSFYPIQNLYFYTNKKGQEYSYNKLINYTVKEGENCPNNKKQCGYLTEDSILCLNDTDICPINDIIINNQSTFSVDNITYNHIATKHNNIATTRM